MDLKVAILEDDEMFVKHLCFILNRLGIQNIRTCNTSNFSFVTSFEKFDIVIVDALLENGASGLDFIEPISKNNHTFIWLMSGVIKKDHIPRNIRPQIHSFFKKPIDEAAVEEALNKIKGSFSKKPLKEGVLDSFLDSDPDLSWINENPNIQGHDLGTLIYLLSESRWTGRVKLKGSEKKYNTILEFLEGDLFSIRTLDQKSFFGALAKAHGFVTEKTIKSLAAKGEGLIGEKLVNEGHLSPHSIQFILEEQAKIRLSQVMDSLKRYKVRLDKRNIQKPQDGVLISFQQKPSFLLEILWGKVSLEWLQNFFSDKSNYIFQLSHRKINGVDERWRENFEKIINSVDSHKTFSEIKKDLLSSVPEQDLLFSFYYLLTIKSLTYSVNEARQKNIQDLEDKLNNLKEKMENNDYFEVLNLPKTAPTSEIKDRVNHIVRVFHPDRYSDPKLKALANEISSYLNKIKQTLLGEKTREVYIKKEKRKEDMQIAYLFSNYKKASEGLLREKMSFEEVLSLLEPIKDNPSLPEDVKLYYLWASLKKESVDKDSDSSGNNSSGNTKYLESILDRVSVELKCTALYFYVKALYSIKKKNVSLAQEYLNKSLSVEENFFPARLEMAKMNKNKISLKKIFSKAS